MRKNRSVTFLAILVIVANLLLSTACSVGRVASLASPTPTIAPTPTATPTATITLSPSPTINQDAIDEAKANQAIQDFLNKTGVYSDEAMQDRLMTYQGNRIALGWMGEGEGTVDFQGEFFGYIKSGDYLLMAVGFNGIDGQNHVKPVAIPIEFFRFSDGETNIFPFQFRKLGDWSLLTSHKLAFEKSLKCVEKRLCAVEDNPIILSFSVSLSDDIEAQGIGRFGETSRCYFEEFKQTGALYSGLMSEVIVKANEKVVLQKSKYSLNSDTTIPDIVSMEDLKNIDISLVPRIFAISSNLW